jgi:hypothetical protein
METDCFDDLLKLLIAEEVAKHASTYDEALVERPMHDMSSVACESCN